MATAALAAERRKWGYEELEALDTLAIRHIRNLHGTRPLNADERAYIVHDCFNLAPEYPVHLSETLPDRELVIQWFRAHEEYVTRNFL